MIIFGLFCICGALHAKFMLYQRIALPEYTSFIISFIIEEMEVEQERTIFCFRAGIRVQKVTQTLIDNFVWDVICEVWIVSDCSDQKFRL